MKLSEKYRVGIDVGGTFTDIVFIGKHSGKIIDIKILNADDNRVDSVLKGIKKLCKLEDISFKDIDSIGHGTTITTNAVIERKGSKTALITNKNFRDILEIGRFSRPPELIYSIHKNKPDPLVPRYLRYGLNCRIDKSGVVVSPINEPDLANTIETLKKEEVESVAVSFLFSFLNSEHEEYVKDEIEKKLSKIEVVLSSEIMREFREFPRTSTTVFAAYVAPILREYITTLINKLDENGITSPLYIFQSNGGISEPEIVMRNPALTLLSGPAGAVVGARFYGGQAGYKNLITMDIGGTSLDICLINDSKAQITSNREIDMFPVSSPMLDVNTVGAGGGSIIFLDEVGRIKVGPESMGAKPGPACYGFGGKKLTVTDINFLMGLFDKNKFANGELNLDYESAKNALIKEIIEPLKLSFSDALIGVYSVVTNQIGEAIRKISVEAGKDPRDYVLVSFGGGGPLHAAAVAKELGIKKIIIPKFPGLFSSLGIASANFSHDYVQSFVTPVDKINFNDLNNVLENIFKQVHSDLNKENIEKNKRQIITSFDMRYIGQTTEVNIELGESKLPIESFVELLDLFHDAHKNLYTYNVPGEPVEVVNIRVRGIGKVDVVNTFSNEKLSENILSEGSRPILIPGQKQKVDVPIYKRNKIPIGSKLKGPLLVEESSSSTLVLNEMILVVDNFANLIIKLDI